MRGPVVAGLLFTLLVCTIELASAQPAARNSKAGSQTKSESLSSSSQALPCPTARSQRTQLEGLGHPYIKRTAKNTAEFNHRFLCSPTDFPFVLQVDDGAEFQLLIAETDPRKFNYAISVFDEGKLPTISFTTGKPVLTTLENLQDVNIPFIHNKAFRRYRVTIAVKPEIREPPKAAAQPPKAATPDTSGLDFATLSRLPGWTAQEKMSAYIAAGTTEEDRKKRREEIRQRLNEPIELYAVTFDVWVRTRVGWHVDATGGVAFSGLVNRSYFVKTDIKGTPDREDDAETVEDDPESDAFRPDIIALANLHNPDGLPILRDFGIAFGVGMNNNADPRYFLGGTYTIGNSFILGAGWAGGKVNRLPAGQFVGEPPLTEDVLSEDNRRQMFDSSWWFGIAFTFINRDKEFAAAFGAPAKTTKETEAPPKDTVVPDDLEGSYFDKDKKTEIVVKKDTDDVLKVTIGKIEASLKKDPTADLTYSGEAKAGGVVQKVDVSFVVADGKVTGLSYKIGELSGRADRKPDEK